MKVTTKWSKRSLFVVAIHVPTMNTRYPRPQPHHLSFSLLMDGYLEECSEQDCEIIDRSLKDFVLMDAATFDDRIVTFMWRPLAEQIELWPDIWDRKPSALAVLKQMATGAESSDDASRNS